MTRPFGNTLLVIRIATYLGNSKPSMARPCIIGIDGERVGASLENRRAYIPAALDPGAMRFSLSLSLYLGILGILRRNARLYPVPESLPESLVILRARTYIDLRAAFVARETIVRNYK